MSLRFKQNPDGSWIGYQVNEKQNIKTVTKPTEQRIVDRKNFENMTDEQLAEYAEAKGIDISRVRSREAAIAKLEKSEGTE